MSLGRSPLRAVLLAALSLVASACASGGDGATTTDDGGAADDTSRDAAIDGAHDGSSEVSGDTCTEGASCTPAACHRGKLSCASATCTDLGPAPAGTACGVFSGSFVCNAGGDCVPCVTGDACVPDGAPCTAGKLDCSAGKPTCVGSGPAPKNTSCGTNEICDSSGACVADVVTTGVGCGSGTKTGNQLCVDKGFASATTANGYGWWQCGGPLDCPGGFTGDGTTCPDFCGGADCVGVAFCGSGHSITTRLGDGATTFTADELGVPCSGYNPGWTVRLRCRF